MGQVIEADEHGLLRVPVEMLGAVQPHSRYIVEVVGKKLVVEPQTAAEHQQAEKAAAEEWLKQWNELAKEIGKVWPEGVSAIDVVSEMRR